MYFSTNTTLRIQQNSPNKVPTPLSIGDDVDRGNIKLSVLFIKLTICQSHKQKELHVATVKGQTYDIVRVNNKKSSFLFLWTI